ncbi:hypothetical protein E2L06_10645 [Haloterrigena sp. H1]|uniref:hypothetical protein n=1 Tax=Haloterrigena sp. H1 TaxID=2552943 RepID=UPI00110E9F81|nr:hypothetical protein [Haloterrigena sp. H1]TMT87020.1 hypothetical protein E2L06_10645 [Haloterrigena sp. H1]
MSLIFVSYSAVTIGPAEGYEISIYSAYPLAFWLFILTVITCGAISVVIGFYLGEEKRVSGYPGIIMFASANTILLALPLFRGYPVYGKGDILSHLGDIRIIVNQSYIPNGDFYPLMHIFYSELASVTGVTPGRISSVGSIVFYIGFLLSVFIVSRRLIGRRSSVMVVLFMTPFMHTYHHVANQPAFLAFFLFPFLLFTFIKSRADLFFLFYLAIAFLHPLSALFSILFVNIMFVFYWLFPEDKKEAQNGRAWWNSQSFVNFSAVSILTIYSWYFSFEAIQRRFISLIMSWASSGETSTSSAGTQGGRPGGFFSNAISIITSKITEADFTNVQLADLIFSRMGQMFAYYSIFGLAICWLLYQVGLKRARPPRSVLVFTGLAVTAAIFGGVILVLPWPITGLTRNLKWTTLFVTIALPFMLNHISNRSGLEAHRVIQSIVVVTVISAAIVGAFNVHPSPNIYKSNPQVTEAQIDGSGWYLDYRSEDQIALYSHAPLDRLMHYHSDPIHYQNIKSQIPPHFGYSSRSQDIRGVSNQTVSLHTTPVDRQFPLMFPPNVRQNIAQYNEKDFNQLRSDPAVNSVYTNGGYEIWYVS